MTSQPVVPCAPPYEQLSSIANFVCVCSVDRLIKRGAGLQDPARGLCGKHCVISNG